ncbi:helix-turn-helix domain-containing protein [Thermoactinomyces mirandus]|uniref:MerR family transcriptional regulator n=1 Tax=Thermoactinomyces mirandus TaxID=2756294 RepID=A0A7W1XRI8_9BACL|nr:helix-turn-helix domain-containing protein [Thermoactinomyces mirandus]MBA4601934.1 MerR family transcriptional regulator [Thermoactinomyces mirandus]
MSRRRKWETIQQAEYVTISELVRLSGVRYSTIKYYTEEGLVPFEQEDIRLTRRYPRVDALKRLEIISRWRKDGLTISEIKEKLGV